MGAMLVKAMDQPGEELGVQCKDNGNMYLAFLYWIYFLKLVNLKIIII